MSTTYWFEFAALPDGVHRGVRATERDGRWISMETDVPQDHSADQSWHGVTLPGFANCHSHAFHRALRGRTHHGGGTFWTWREQMYAVAAQLNPENYLALARATYAEMALAGITAVGEFHYVHHRPGGEPHAEPHAMGDALRQAARDAGIRLTLLDTCYLQGGLTAEGHVPLSPEQLRFSDGTAQAWASRHQGLAGDDNTVIGAAIHSVRAVHAQDIPTVVEAAAGQPLHAHVSEQPAENDAATAFYDETPTAILAKAGAVGENFTAVHATHLKAGDLDLLGTARATACICPSTERDLADGIGPSPALLEHGTRLSLGSDQHAMIDMFDDARALELHERLITNVRGHLTQHQLLEAATQHASIGWPDAGSLAVGQRADAVNVTLRSPRTAGASPSQILMAATAADVREVLSGGRRVVTDGKHVLGDVAGLLHDAITTLWEEEQ